MRNDQMRNGGFFLLSTSSIICFTLSGMRWFDKRAWTFVPPLFIRLLPNYPLAVQRRRTSVPTTFIRKKAYYQKKDKRGSSSFPHLSLSALPFPTCEGLMNVRAASANECTRTSVTCRAAAWDLCTTTIYVFPSILNIYNECCERENWFHPKKGVSSPSRQQHCTILVAYGWHIARTCRPPVTIHVFRLV